MKVLITGGAGFIGSNAAARYIDRGADVVLIDNLHRRGTTSNLNWLKQRGRLTFENADIRDAASIQRIFRANRDASLVLHLAGQVAVTSSVSDPMLDFQINALGTLNVLEAMRRGKMEAPIIYTSTNKVYGGLASAKVVEHAQRWELESLPAGIAEDHPTDFHSPYGCSKGAADQYVRDYNRIYGLNTVVFRQSCIYGTRQFGHEDQGWIAWFLIAAELGLPLTLFGDGKQVRDVLFIDDLLDAFDLAAEKIAVARGKIYNIGGGPVNSISLLELLDYLSVECGIRIDCRKAAQRPGDQRIYVSDIRRARSDLGWQPRIGWKSGVKRLAGWVVENREECRIAFTADADKRAVASEV